MPAFPEKWQGRILALVLTVCLTITGIYDFVIIVRDNGPGHRVTVNINSSLTDWLAQNLDSRDLILTPEYSISEVTMAGVMMYLGWPIMRGQQDMILLAGRKMQRKFILPGIRKG